MQQVQLHFASFAGYCLKEKYQLFHVKLAGHASMFCMDGFCVVLN